MRTIIIGDVHGCIDELRSLIKLVQPGTDDHVIFVGDLVHRGPDSPGVIRYVGHWMRSVTRVTLVMGNHEEKHNRWRRNVALGRADKMSHVEEYPAIEAKLDDHDRAFMESAVLFHRMPEYKAIVLHGGLMPEQRLPETPDLDGVTGRERKSMMRILRIRDITPDGQEMVKLGQKTDEDVFWTDLYDGRHGHVFFGHHPFTGAVAPCAMRPYESRPIGPVGERPGTSQTVVATAMDLGCVFGGHLAAVIMEEGKPLQTVTVKALEKYSPDWQFEE